MKKLLIIAVIILIGFSFIKLATPNYPEPTQWNEYEICSGETLWQIANNINDDKELDTNYIIHLITKHNDCDANIKAGQVILIPKF